MKKIISLFLFLFSYSSLADTAYSFPSCPAGTGQLVKGYVTTIGTWSYNGGTCNGKPDSRVTLNSNGAETHWCYDASWDQCSCGPNAAKAAQPMLGVVPANRCSLSSCENGLPRLEDGSCPVSSSSSSASSAPACTTSQYFDPLLNSCAELVDNASDCGSEDYALQMGSGFACYTEQPDNTHCLANIVVTPNGTSTVYSCTTSNNSNSSSAASSAASSSGSGSGTSSGSNSSTSPQQQALENCELTFGVGNCQANTNPTPCPNSFKQNGITYCVTSNSSGSGSSSSASNGSGSSASSGNGSGSSASAGNATATNCSSEPTCTGGDPIQCAFLKQIWINNCDGIEKKIDIDANTDNANINSDFQDLVDNNQTDLNSDGTIAGATGEIDVSQYVDMVSNLNNAANQASSGTCPAPRVIHISLGSFEVTFDPLCELAEGISYFVLLFFSISGSLIIYRTVERI